MIERRYSAENDVDDTFRFWYRNGDEQHMGNFSPYSAHTVSVAGKIYPTAAHLYWANRICPKCRDLGGNR